MAITNQERVGKAMELLREGIAPYVDREVQEAIKAGSVRMEAIRRLRPEFLVGSSRNGTRASEPTVYVDDVYEGELWRLSSIPRSAVREVIFLHPTEAGLRFGVMCRCPGGVVNVRTRISRT